jgi:LytR cell envelope-related transcriptional attenuator
VNPGRHAADDGSFGRSAGGAMLRGALLLAIAVILGVALLNRFDNGTDPFAQNLAASGRATTTTTTAAAPPETTTTAAAAAPRLRAPADVKVLPANGTGVNRFGARVGDELKKSGFNVLSPVDSTTKGVTTSVVYSTAGYEADAADVATKLGLPPTAVQAAAPPVKSVELRGANVIVVAGSDLTSRLK